jgi:hypothetical protein
MKAFFAFATIGMATACSDTVSAPPQQQVLGFKAPAGYNRVMGTSQFTVSPSGTVQRLGSHVISFQSDAVCDPAISTYGPTEWDQPCTTITEPLTVTATMMENDAGHPYIDFQPALRFSPLREVNLYLRTGRDSQPTSLDVKYCDAMGDCFDESVTDSTLQTRRVGTSAYLVRRIKHFSGYSVAAGELCLGTLTQELDGTFMCYDEMEDFDMTLFMRRSGYMVASGLAKAEPKTTTAETVVTKKRNDH